MRWVPWGVAALLAGVLLMNLVAPRRSSPQVRHFSIQLAGKLSATFRPAAAIPPDGQQLAYVAESGAEFQLFLRPLDGTMGARNVFWSPDSQWIGFWAEGRLKKLSIVGLPPVSLCRANDIEGASWGGNGTIVYSDARQLYRVHEEGGTAEPILAPDGKQILGLKPELLPGDGAMLFIRGTELGSAIASYEFETAEVRDLMPRGMFVRYVPGDYLLFSRAGAMYASAFDPTSLEFRGSPVPLDVSVAVTSSGLAHISVSRDGTLAHTPGSTSGPRSLMWIDREGDTEPIVEEPGLYFMPRFSPDGEQLAVTLQENDERDVWVIDVATGKRTRLTFDGRSSAPVWSRDGRSVAIMSEGDVGMEIRRLSVAGGRAERLAYAEGGLYPISWAKDGTLLLSRVIPGATEDIYIWDPEHEGSLKPYMQAPVHEQAAVVSPNGDTLAFAAWDEGRSRVYVQPWPGPGSRCPMRGAGCPSGHPTAGSCIFSPGAASIG